MKPTTAKYSVAGAVAVAVALVYLPALRNEFVEWDDSTYVFENFHIRALNLTFLKWAFSSFYAANWHPLTWISHATDFALWGLTPMGHHLTSVVLHGINTLLVALLAMKWVEARVGRAGEGANVAGAVAAALFGLHPAHVESVAWVSERKDLLCAAFFLLSLLLYAGLATSARQPGIGAIRVAPGPYLLSLGAFALALLSKPMAVSLPVVLLILDAFPFGRIRSAGTAMHATVEKLPFVLLAAGSSVVTLLAQNSGGAMSWAEAPPLPARLLVAASALLRYLGNLAFPFRLVPFYPYPGDVSISNPRYFLPVLAVLAITGAAVFFARRRPLWAAAWAYYVVTLLPVLGIVQVGAQAMADRYTYLPSLGPFVAIGVAAAWVFRRIASIARPLAGMRAVAVTLLAMAGILSFLTVRQIGVWRTSFTLWNEVLRHEPTSVPFAHNNRGLAYLAVNDLDRAIADYTKAIELTSGYWSAYVNRGVALLERGDADLAIEDFDRSIAIRPLYRTYHLRGMAFDKKGDFEAARRDYLRAVAMEPSFVDAYVSLGVLSGRDGSFDQALDLFNRAIAIDPNHPLAYGNRGFAYGLRGEIDKALRDLNWAIGLDPDDAKIHFNRGGLYLKAGDRERSLADFRRACELRDQRACQAVARLAGAQSP